MPRSKKNMELKEQVELILERVKNAESTKDFDLIFTNLNVLNDFISNHSAELSTKADLSNKLRICVNRLQYSVDKEMTRRKDITTLGQKYDEADEKLTKCDEATMLYDDVLTSPTAKTFSYSLALSSSALADKVLVDYFNNITDALGLPRGSIDNLADLNNEIAKVEKDMDKLAFDINSKNGTYDEKIIAEDLEKARKLEEKSKNAANLSKKRDALKNALKSENPTIYTKIYGDKNVTPPIPAGGIKELRKQIASLSSIRNKKDPRYRICNILKDLESLQKIPTLSKDEKDELNDIYAKYNISSLDELETIANNIEAEPVAERHSTSPIAPSSIKDTINNTNLSVKNPTRTITAYSVSDSERTGNDIDSCVKYLQQEHGYTPMVGRESIVYARPVYKKGLFGRETKKLAKMEVVEESIASIIKEPIESYVKALTEANKKCKSMGLNSLDINIMVSEFKELIKDDDPKSMDEALKRILSVKCSNSREQLAAIATTHTNIAPVKFLNDSTLESQYYDAPKAKAENIFITNLFPTVKKFSYDRDEASSVATPLKASEYIKYNPKNRTNTPAVSRNVVHDRTHHKDDDRDEI